VGFPAASTDQQIIGENAATPSPALMQLRIRHAMRTTEDRLTKEPPSNRLQRAALRGAAEPER